MVKIKGQFCLASSVIFRPFFPRSSYERTLPTLFQQLSMLTCINQLEKQ